MIPCLGWSTLLLPMFKGVTVLRNFALNVMFKLVAKYYTNRLAHLAHHIVNSCQSASIKSRHILELVLSLTK